MSATAISPAVRITALRWTTVPAASEACFGIHAGLAALENEGAEALPPDLGLTADDVEQRTLGRGFDRLPEGLARIGESRV